MVHLKRNGKFVFVECEDEREARNICVSLSNHDVCAFLKAWGQCLQLPEASRTRVMTQAVDAISDLIAVEIFEIK